MRDCGKKEQQPVSIKVLRNDLVLLMRCIKDAEEQLGGLGQETISQLRGIVISARSAMLRFLSLLEINLKTNEVSPGKLQEEVG